MRSDSDLVVMFVLLLLALPVSVITGEMTFFSFFIMIEFKIIPFRYISFWWSIHRSAFLRLLSIETCTLCAVFIDIPVSDRRKWSLGKRDIFLMLHIKNLLTPAAML